MRLDLALFELRLYKSRSLAQQAIERGQVLLNGREVKASHAVEVGDHLTLAHDSVARTLEIVGLPRRGSSREAARALVRDIEPR